ncbi:chondroitin-sulfate-ABC endolyase/exolyase [Rubritalea squalenifaciens DSM 18772]|uniref:Chondroitin-sulfate-ABC endolyase/exolyase n=1 Tax=Rubritalea squalenifaciens DSM 18772 TaxID=1123071 RepID=A0A1M6NNV5_9BACT|nr:chondroitinase family polysaccharide lyase [Rubritalea squalenifaciens]SHJ97431.1 chondroitin-sulfate-ABC endolyase/exolyase [Rubritalea squalenifaciens DSM 18772]
MHSYFYPLFAVSFLLSSCHRSQKSATEPQHPTEESLSYTSGNTDAFAPGQEKNPSELLIPSAELPTGLSWQNSSVNTDNTHHVWSDYSLRWDWKNQSSLTLHRPIPWMPPKQARGKYKFPHPVQNCFTVWIYNKTPHKDAKLRFSFGADEKEICHFYFSLNFTGWRTAWVSYDRDMLGEKPSAPMDYVTIQAPANIPKGTLWIGDTMIHKFIDARHQHGDPQVPFVHGADTKKAGHWDPIMHLYELGQNQRADNPITGQEMKALATIAKRLEMKEKSQPLNDKILVSLEKQFATYGIIKDEHGIRGKHIYMEHQQVGAPENLEQFQAHTLQQTCDFLLNLARTYNRVPQNDRAEAKALRVAEMFCLLTEHMLDQGFTAGSSLGTMHHFGYRTRSWVPAISAMQEPLAKARLLEQARESLVWFYNSNRIFAPVEELANMDYLNTLSQADFTIQMIGEDNAAKVARIKRYSQWISETISSESPGTTSGFKPDGSLFHHAMHYHGYGIPAIDKISTSVVHKLDGTPFEITPEAYEVLKRAYLAANYWGYPYCGFNACGRHPITHDLTSSRGALQKLALSRPGTSDVDSELAACYLEMFGGDSQKLFVESISPSRTQGFHVMNYNAGGSYKWGNSTVQLKGFGDGIKSHETYRDANRYGRYLSHGSTQIFKTTSDHKSGQLNEGWNWSQIPGTTSQLLPFDELEGSKGFYGWGPKQQSYPSGAGKLGKHFGAFLFQLDPSKDDQSLRIRKSVFLIDREIICLGSGISNQSKTYPTITTVFQAALPTKGEDLSSQGDGWLIDPFGTGYYLPGDQNLKHHSGLQKSPDQSDRKPTSGNFSTAWLEHGITPRNASYQYHIVLDATPELMKTWHSEHAAHYQIIQQDDTAHVIANKSKNLEATAAFSPYQSKGDTTLLSTDRSCIALIRHQADKSLQLSITDIDLPLAGKAPLSPTTVIELKGKWSLSTSKGDKGIQLESSGENTRLLITTWRGESVQMQLTPSAD